MFKKFERKIFLKDGDILHSLNFNIILSGREYIISENKIIYSDYKIFNHKEELNGYYSKNDKKIILYISKSDKIKQLFNNIALFLNIPVEQFLYKIEKNSIYINVYKLIKKNKVRKTFDFIIFFKKFEWVKNVEKLKNDILKIEIKDNEYLKYEYDIIQEKYFVIMASKKDNEFIIINPIDSYIKIGIKYNYL